MTEEIMYDVVLMDNDKITVLEHSNRQSGEHVTGVFLTRKEACTNARKLSRQHGLVYVK